MLPLNGPDDGATLELPRLLLLCRLTSTLLVAVLVLSVVSCSVHARPPAPKSAAPGDQVPPRAVVPVVLGGDLRRTDPFSLDSAAVKDDVLTVVVSYSGGCRNHEFALTAPRSFQVSAGSVQLPITLIHDANGDPCEAYPSEQLRFDLRPISQLYQETFNQDSGTVDLLLAGHSGPLIYRL